MKEKLDIFDWKLSPDELQKISGIPQRRGGIPSELISDEGPYKSLSEEIGVVLNGGWSGFISGALHSSQGLQGCPGGHFGIGQRNL